ncbi:hypothetical protein QUF58_01255 [Anaerolineales bacterium HSG24]|nr:hypothetical protein [Anaerolineales bacterium HSG24]
MSNTPDKFQQGIDELRSLLFKPEEMANGMKPYLNQILATQMDETRRQITETVAPVLGEALRRVERKSEKQNLATQQITQTVMNEAVNKVEQIAAEQTKDTQKIGLLLQQLAQAEQARQQMVHQLDDTLTEVKAISDQQQKLADNMTTLPAPVPPPPTVSPVEQRREIVQAIYPAIHQMVDDAVFQATEKMEQSLLREQEAVRKAEERSSFWFKLLTIVIVLLLLLLGGVFCAWASSINQAINDLQLSKHATSTAKAIALLATATNTPPATPDSATPSPVTEDDNADNLTEQDDTSNNADNLTDQDDASNNTDNSTGQDDTSNSTDNSTGQDDASNNTDNSTEQDDASNSTDNSAGQDTTSNNTDNSTGQDTTSNNTDNLTEQDTTSNNTDNSTGQDTSNNTESTHRNSETEQGDTKESTSLASTDEETSQITANNSTNANQFNPTPTNQDNHASPNISITGTIIANITPLDAPNGQAIDTTLLSATDVTVVDAKDKWYQLAFLLPETGAQFGWIPVEYVQLHEALPASFLPKTGDR